MSTTSSLYTGISGMLTASQGISVVSNNLANASTVGYKASVITFEDTFYQAISSANGWSQVGTGSQVSDIYGNFDQGAIETGTEATDLAISGNGYFQLLDEENGTLYYTRAGDFRFNEDGYLVDTHDYQVQGWSVDDDGNPVGALGSIEIDNTQSPPSPTSSVTMYTNLDSSADDNSTSATSPFFSMLENWDGTEDTPLGDELYEYSTTITVYDENGSSHKLTVYYDPVSEDSYINGDSGSTVYEYIVTCDPSEDGRTIDGQTLSETSGGGLLMAGTMTFNSSGEVTGMTSYTLQSNASGDMTDLNNWTTADVSDNGLATFTANFTGLDGADSTGDENSQDIEIDFGVSTGDTANPWSADTASNAGLIGTDYSSLGNYSDMSLGSTSVTSYNDSSTTLSQSQDGYASGYLLELSVSNDGVITGTYSNGQIEDLYVLCLTTFASEDGLQRAGGSLFTQTRDSGEAITGTANTGSLGYVQSNALEASNVDMASEMVDMIVYQRVYDAASKVISTADTMLQTATQLKR